jgi:large subunit ribosomal protein L29
MKASDLREKSVEDLRELRASLAQDTFQNRLKNFTNRLDDTSAIRKTKRDVARVITLLRERELGANPVEAAADAAPAPVAAPKAQVAPSAVEGASPKKKSSKKSETKQP